MKIPFNLISDVTERHELIYKSWWRLSQERKLALFLFLLVDSRERLMIDGTAASGETSFCHNNKSLGLLSKSDELSMNHQHSRERRNGLGWCDVSYQGRSDLKIYLYTVLIGCATDAQCLVRDPRFIVQLHGIYSN